MEQILESMVWGSLFRLGKVVFLVVGVRPVRIEKTQLVLEAHKGTTTRCRNVTARMSMLGDALVGVHDDDDDDDRRFDF